MGIWAVYAPELHSRNNCGGVLGVARQAEIRDFQDPAVGYQNVAQFEIPMHDVVLVDELQSREQLPRHVLDLGHFEGFPVLFQSRQVAVDEFKCEKNRTPETIVVAGPRRDDILQLHDVWMALQPLQSTNFRAPEQRLQ